MKLKPVLDKYGRWTPLERIGSRCGSPLWRCRCDCGNFGEIILRHLRTGASSSCGCFRNERIIEVTTTHGDTHAPEYRAWGAMLSRCRDNNLRSVINYQMRGIKVCKRWEKYENFLEDMGRKPSAKHSIDRIDNDGDYEPNNCRWATHKEQANNRRRRISTKTKLAAALLALGHIPYEDSKVMTSDIIISLFHFDHGILHATAPINEPWNLTPRLIASHRQKTKRDIAIVAKAKRIDKKWREFTANNLAKPPKRETKWRWGSRKMQSTARRK